MQYANEDDIFDDHNFVCDECELAMKYTYISTIGVHCIEMT